MNRRNRRAALSQGVDVTKKMEKVLEYTGDAADSPLQEVERDASDPRIPFVGPSDPRPMANPGQSAKLKIYPNPDPEKAGETVRGYRRHPHSVLYTGSAGLREYMPLPSTADPAQAAVYEASFEHMSRAEGLRLVTRQERREMYRAEQARVSARKKRQREEVARILAESGVKPLELQAVTRILSEHKVVT